MDTSPDEIVAMVKSLNVTSEEIVTQLRSPLPSLMSIASQGWQWREC